MKRLTSLLCGLALSLCIAVPLAARSKFQDYVQIGGQTAIISLIGTSAKFQRSFTACTINVYIDGTTTPATIYSNSSGTVIPGGVLTSDSTGHFQFWGDSATYSVKFTPSGFAAWTISGWGGGGASAANGVFDVTVYGAKGDLRTVTDGAITVSLAIATSATAAFTTADVGKQIQVSGAGAAGATLYTTIQSYTNATTVVLANVALTSSSSATIKIYTDDGVAIGLATAALQANGGGRLVFPWALTGTYGTYGHSTVYTQLGAFTSIPNMSMQFDGSTVYVSGDHMSSGTGTAFLFTTVTGFTASDPRVVGEVTTALVQSGSFHGIKFFEFRHDCANIDIPRMSVNGIGVPVEFNNNPTGTYDGLPHSRGIHIGVLDVSNSIYGLDAQYSMDDAVIDALHTDNITRSFFIYGSTNVFARIHSKNNYGDDVKLWGVAGYGLTNVRIIYTVGAESTARVNSGNLIALDFVGPTACTHKNISVDATIEYAGSGTNNTGSSWFQINKYISGGSAFDTTDRGHILDGLTISGNIKNYPNDGGVGGAEIPSPNSKWGPTLDSWYNLRIVNLSLTNAKFVRIGCAALKGPLYVEGFRSDQAFSNLIIQQDDYIGAPDVGPPTTGQYQIVNSSYANQYAISNSDRPSGVVYLGTNIALGVGSRNQTIVNTGCGGTCTATLPTATVGLSYTFVRTAGFAFRQAPQAADQIRGASGVNKYIQIDANGAEIILSCTTAGVWDTHYFMAPTDVSFQP